jgi:hypothetical protein
VLPFAHRPTSIDGKNLTRDEACVSRQKENCRAIRIRWDARAPTIERLLGRHKPHDVSVATGSR